MMVIGVRMLERRKRRRKSKREINFIKMTSKLIDVNYLAHIEYQDEIGTFKMNFLTNRNLDIVNTRSISGL